MNMRLKQAVLGCCEESVKSYSKEQDEGEKKERRKATFAEVKKEKATQSAAIEFGV